MPRQASRDEGKWVGVTSVRHVRELFYRRWMVSTLPMALVVVAMLFAQGAPLAAPLTVVWLQFVVYLLHEFEEHVFPGGFKDFVNEKLAGPPLQKRYRGRVPAKDFPLDDRSVFWINILFIWIVFPLGAILAARDDLAWGALLPAIGMVNASLHILIGVVKRCYNPGLVVSVVVNIPTGIWTFAVLADAGVSSAQITASVVAAVVMHIGLVVWMILSAVRVLR